MESESPYLGDHKPLNDVADLQGLLALVQLGVNLTQADEDAIDTITIRLLRWAESRNDRQAIDRYQRLRLALRSRFAPG